MYRENCRPAAQWSKFKNQNNTFRAYRVSNYIGIWLPGERDGRDKFSNRRKGNLRQVMQLRRRCTTARITKHWCRLFSLCSFKICFYKQNPYRPGSEKSSECHNRLACQIMHHSGLFYFILQWKCQFNKHAADTLGGCIYSIILICWLRKSRETIRTAIYSLLYCNCMKSIGN